MKVVVAVFLSDKLTALEAISVHWTPLLLYETLKERVQENEKRNIFLKVKNPLFLAKNMGVSI